MTVPEIGNLLLLLGMLLMCLFLGRALSIGWSLGMQPLHTAPVAGHHPHGRRLVALVVAGASVYVGRHLAPAALAGTLAAMLLGSVLSLLG